MKPSDLKNYELKEKKHVKWNDFSQISARLSFVFGMGVLLIIYSALLGYSLTVVHDIAMTCLFIMWGGFTILCVSETRTDFVLVKTSEVDGA